jgi:hypothetical protein
VTFLLHLSCPTLSGVTIARNMHTGVGGGGSWLWRKD